MKETKLLSILLCYPAENKFSDLIKDIKINKTRIIYYYSINGIDIMFLNKKSKSLWCRQLVWDKFVFNDNFHYIITRQLIEFLFEFNFNITISYAYTNQL